MSVSSQLVEYSTKSEIYKTLKLIQDDIIKVKRELFAIQSITKDGGPLKGAIKTANKTLTNLAKEKGIDIENLINEGIDSNVTDATLLNYISTTEVTHRIQELLKD